MCKNNNPMDEGKYPWCLIGGIRDKKESFEKALARRVEKEMGIKVEKVEFVSESCYHARLTDSNVNQIERAEGKLLNFFTLEETKKLFLSDSAQQFIPKFASLIW